MNWLKAIWLLITNIKTIIDLAKKLWGLISPILQTFQGKKVEPQASPDSGNEEILGGDNQTAPKEEKPKRRGLFRRLRNRRND